MVVVKRLAGWQMTLRLRSRVRMKSENSAEAYDDKRRAAD